jgi:sigma-B regulation protein RsbU (phosphoserine phosphatase)
MRLPLGVKQEVDYGEVTVQLQPGDVMIFYTDGLSEAMNEKNELFGFERMEAAVRQLPSPMRAAVIIDTLLKAVSQFSGSAQQHDDMTVVALRMA